MNKLQLFLAIAATLVVSGAANAFDGDSSNTSNVAVGVSTVNAPPFHYPNRAGIAVNSSGLTNFVDFESLKNYGSSNNSTVDWGTHTVYELNFPYTGAPEDHDNLGVFAFAQAGDGDVWFGEWSAYGTSDATRTVYYSGLNEDTSIPGSISVPVEATYNVVGINNYDPTSGGNLLSGQFDATFYGVTGTLTGDIENASGFNINIGNATISATAVISSSNAVASDTGGTLASSGTVSGRFFNSYADLAGIVDFSGTQYDTAFGGSVAD